MTVDYRAITTRGHIVTDVSGATQPIIRRFIPNISLAIGGSRCCMMCDGALDVQGIGSLVVGGNTVTIQSWSNNLVYFTLPAHAVGSVSAVLVNSEGGTDTYNKAITYVANVVDYFSALQDSLYQVFQPLLGKTLIYANQNAKAPDFPYYEIYVTPLTKLGQDYNTSPDDATETSELVGNREFIVRFRGFGSGAIAYLQHIVDSLETVQVIQALRDEGVTYVDEITGVIDITETVDDSKMEERASVELLFRTASVLSTSTSIIEKANDITATYKVGDTVIATETFDIPQT